MMVRNILPIFCFFIYSTNSAVVKVKRSPDGYSFQYQHQVTEVRTSPQKFKTELSARSSHDSFRAQPNSGLPSHTSSYLRQPKQDELQSDEPKPQGYLESRDFNTNNRNTQVENNQGNRDDPYHQKQAPEKNQYINPDRNQQRIQTVTSTNLGQLPTQISNNQNHQDVDSKQNIYNSNNRDPQISYGGNTERPLVQNTYEKPINFQQSSYASQSSNLYFPTDSNNPIATNSNLNGNANYQTANPNPNPNPNQNSNPPKNTNYQTANLNPNPNINQNYNSNQNQNYNSNPPKNQNDNYNQGQGQQNYNSNQNQNVNYNPGQQLQSGQTNDEYSLTSNTKKPYESNNNFAERTTERTMQLLQHVRDNDKIYRPDELGKIEIVFPPTIEYGNNIRTTTRASILDLILNIKTTERSIKV